MSLLGVNIDHVATVRQARRGDDPDVIAAAGRCEAAGADIITVHLREDRRHIQDRDVETLARVSSVKLNLEMGATDEMVGIALTLRKSGAAPQMCTLVPESRQELTTEGGLNVAGQAARLKDVVARLKSAPGGMLVSAFIDAEPTQIAAAKAAGFDACEIHTGPYAAAFVARKPEAELAKVAAAGKQIRALGMQFNAGHALNYANVKPIAHLPEMAELHIGHAIICRAIFTGIGPAVSEMKRLMNAV